MRFLIELDGPVFDIAAAYYAAHRAAAEAVGWSRLEQATFWRLTRTKGPQADILPGARDGKVAEYHARFAEIVESQYVPSLYQLQPEAVEHLRMIGGFGSVFLATLGANIDARTELFQSNCALTPLSARGEKGEAKRHSIAPSVGELVSLSQDPRRRPKELKKLAGSDPRTLVVAASDSLIRSAGSAELFAVGLSCGACTARRLYQAGAAVVYEQLTDLAASLEAGAPDLIRAGLPPSPLE